jgi:hypothetical protein
MKTFKDLEFNPHPIGEGIHARLEFKNGYGVSVVQGRYFYCDSNTYEVAIIYQEELCYTTDLTDDVLTHQTESDIDRVMAHLQKLHA